MTVYSNAIIYWKLMGSSTLALYVVYYMFTVWRRRPQQLISWRPPRWSRSPRVFHKSFLPFTWISRTSSIIPWRSLLLRARKLYHFHNPDFDWPSALFDNESWSRSRRSWRTWRAQRKLNGSKDSQSGRKSWRWRASATTAASSQFRAECFSIWR